jgi:hypothetical protein
VCRGREASAEGFDHFRLVSWLCTTALALDSGGVGLIRYEESHIMGFVCAEDVRERFFPIICHYNMTSAAVEGRECQLLYNFFKEIRQISFIWDANEKEIPRKRSNLRKNVRE